MGLSKFSVNRPVALTIILAIVLMLGAFTFTSLKVDLLPNMDLPIAAVITSYSGAGPEEVESQITYPLENSLNALSNIETIQSESMSGSSIVVLQFGWGTNMDTTMNDIRDSLSLAEQMLPDAAGKPMLLKLDPNMMPVIQLGVFSDNMSLAQLQQIAEDTIEPRLRHIPEIASVSVSGGLEREVQVQIDPVKMQNYGLTITQVSQILMAENFNASGGNVVEGERKYFVRSLQQFETVDDIKNVAVTAANGQSLVLSDFAAIIDGYKDDNQIARVNGMPSVNVSCSKQSDANTVAACEAVKEELDSVAEYLKGMGVDIDIHVVIDQSDYITQSIASTQRMLVEGAILAAIVLFMFLRNFRSTLIVFTAIPISIISTFILMYFNNNTLNIITLGGLALGLGRMVDDSIVVYENIYRHRSMGLSMKEAALKGTRQVGRAVIASTMTILAVFLPILFTEGIAGILFKPMAITISFAILCSLFVSLTVIPFLSSRFLSDKSMGFNEYAGKGAKRFSGFSSRTGKAIDSLGEKYKRALKWALRHRKLVIAATSAAMIGSLAFIPLIGAEFMPAMDSGQISVSISSDKGNKLENTDAIVIQIEERLRQVAEVDTIFSNVGGDGNVFFSSETQGDTAAITIQLLKSSERSRDVNAVAEDIRGRIAGIAGTKITVTVSDSSLGGGLSGGAPINLQINGDDLEQLTLLAEQVTELVRSVSGTREVSSSLQDGNPEVQVRVLRERASQLGLTPAQVSTEVRNALQGTVASRYRVGGDEIDIRVKYVPGSFNDMESLSNLNIRTGLGTLVPLYQVADINMVSGPTTISRVDQVRQAQVSAYLLNRDLQSVIGDIQLKLNELTLPSGYEVKFAGAQEDMMESFQSLAIALLMALILVYGVMAVQYESFFAPFIIMFSIPTSIVGVIIGLVISRSTFSVPAFIGIIMLVGIVVANAIIFVDYLQQLRAEGMERDEAILETGRIRLRPILMTALATIFAMVPLSLGLGEGSEASAPIGIVVIGGLTGSTFFTLLLVPVMYSILDDWRDKFRAKNKPAAVAGGTGDSGILYGGGESAEKTETEE
ncbi:MAG: efflux RND transporter permease subunit [Syntrophomonadaceae bacterium]|jgi:HAE1 family hydrophobic/amphiphilic exporter-1|nr:efflux RND transporter permease subunit [Syntrophomonadaceae bacterium]